MILSFINIRKVPREVLKTEGEFARSLGKASVFNTSLGTLQILMNGKSCLIPILVPYVIKRTPGLYGLRSY